MGILNVTPDSFSDGGSYADAERCGRGRQRHGGRGRGDHRRRRRIDPARRASRCGKATRSSGSCRSIQQLAAGGTAVSIDTRKASGDGGGARRRRAAGQRRFGADLRSALGGSGRGGGRAGGADASPGRRRRRCRTTPRYDDVLVEVYHWLEERIAAAEAAGIARDEDPRRSRHRLRQDRSRTISS